MLMGNGWNILVSRTRGPGLRFTSQASIRRVVTAVEISPGAPIVSCYFGNCATKVGVQQQLANLNPVYS